MAGIRGRSGQSMTETLVMFPVFLIGMLFVLQLGQIGVAVLVVNYGASSIAKKAVSIDGRMPNAEEKLNSLFVAGMKNPQVTQKETLASPPLRELTVETRADVGTFPLIGKILSDVLGGNRPIGPMIFSTSPPYPITVVGQATVRANYSPK